jgi:hypothetical protein
MQGEMRHGRLILAALELGVVLQDDGRVLWPARRPAR